MQTPKRLAKAVVLAALVALALTVGKASAAPPCWKQVINDWYDGRIDKIYPKACYKQAIKHLPSDVEIYSNARSDIERALQAALVGKLPPPNSSGGGTNGGGNNNNGGSSGTSTEPTGGEQAGETPLTGRLIDKLGPSKADSAPIPLLVLGGLALVLMAAGGSGVLWRRYQAKRLPPPQT
jgi:hypothetical protein